MRALQLDDHESLLLAAWVRTGWWAAPGAAGVDRALVSTSAAAAPTLALRVAGGRLAATLTLDPDTYLPARMTQPLCGGVEAWEYSRWTPWPGAARGALFPGATAHAGTAGGGNAFHVALCSVVPAITAVGIIVVVTFVSWTRWKRVCCRGPVEHRNVRG